MRTRRIAQHLEIYSLLSGKKTEKSMRMVGSKPVDLERNGPVWLMARQLQRPKVQMGMGQANSHLWTTKSHIFSSIRRFDRLNDATVWVAAKVYGMTKTMMKVPIMFEF